MVLATEFSKKFKNNKLQFLGSPVSYQWHTKQNKLGSQLSNWSNLVMEMAYPKSREKMKMMIPETK